MNSLQLVVFSIVVFSGVYVHGNDDFRTIDSIYNELPCLVKGGICTVAADCPAQRLVGERNLCPNQRSQGVECCYGVSVKETRCRNLGGECMSECWNTKQASDCHESTVCCVLTN